MSVTKSKEIGVLYGNNSENGLTHDFFSAILEGFKKSIEARGYHMCFINTNKIYPGRKRFLQQIRELGYAGVFIPCIEFDDPEVVEVMSSDIPVATIDSEFKGVISIKSDNKGGMTALMDYLISLNHKNIAFITGEDCLVTRIRLDVYLNCMKKAGIEVPAEYIKKGKFRDSNKVSYLTEELMRLPDTPSCIIFPDDYAAIGGLNVLKARGLEIPSDISVAGFDGIDVISRYEPRLTTVYQDKDGLGKAAAIHLMEAIENPGYKLEEPIIIDTQFQKGRSVSKVYYWN